MVLQMIGYSDLALQYRGYKLTMHNQLRELARHIAREARESFRVLPTVRIPLRLTSSNDIFELWQSQVCVSVLYFIHLVRVVKIILRT